MFVAFACVPPGNGGRSGGITSRLARNVAEWAKIPEVLGKQESLMNSKTPQRREKEKGRRRFPTSPLSRSLLLSSHQYQLWSGLLACRPRRCIDSLGAWTASRVAPAGSRKPAYLPASHLARRPTWGSIAHRARTFRMLPDKTQHPTRCCRPYGQGIECCNSRSLKRSWNQECCRRG